MTPRAARCAPVVANVDGPPNGAAVMAVTAPAGMALAGVPAAVPAVAVWAFALLATAPAPALFEDEAIRVDLPGGWTIEGQGGEYRLLSDEQDAASLLLLLAVWRIPLLFLVSGMSTGAAVIMWMSKSHVERKIMSMIDLVLIIVELFFIIHLFMGFLASTAVQIEAAELFLGGPFTVSFWVFVVISPSSSSVLASSSGGWHSR